MRQLFVIAAMIAGWAMPALASDPVGTVVAVRPQATAQVDLAAPRPLALASPVFKDEMLETGTAGRLAVQMDDGATLILGEAARLRVDDLVMTPDQTAGVVSVLAGAFQWRGGRKLDDGVEIRTPLATIGIRGTVVWGGTLDDVFEVMVQEGRVTVSTDAGSVVLDTPGQGTAVRSRDQPPSAPVVWPQGKRERAYQAVAF
ncbi:FecR family protein [Pararhodospirillum photometricum]|nr:FecR family protein [Pararhodospirillum photometricum]